MHHHDLSRRRLVGVLRFDEHFHFRLGAVQTPIQREASLFPAPLPKVPGDGLQVRIREKGVEGDHEDIEPESPRIDYVIA